MKKVITLAFVIALLLMILTPAVLGVNSTSTSRAAAWADGGVPYPPFPSVVTIWNDGGVPYPPFPS